MDQQKLEPETNETSPQIIGPDGNPMPAKWLTLGIEKFDHPDKHYRLIWIHLGKAWFAEENSTHFRRKHGEGGAIEAGKKLAERVKCAHFSEATR